MIRKFTVIRGAPGRTKSAKRTRGLEPPTKEPSEFKVESVELSAKDALDIARDPSVSAHAPAMPTKLIKPLTVQTDTSAVTQKVAWGAAAVGADKSSFDGTGVIPAVLDTGIDKAHPAFAGVALVEADFTGDGNGDGHGHGTHCAGTIFGRDVAGTRIGIARGVARALIGKVLDANGSGDTDMLYQGMQWALMNGAQVISMSIGYDFPGMVQQAVDEGMRPDVATSQALEAYRYNLHTFDAVMGMVAVRADLPNGLIVVAASGNESRRDLTPPYEIAVSIPAAASGVVSVGAIRQGKAGYEVAYFSNSLPALSAPGVDIVSAQAGGGLALMSGTSMATPHVAGVAALWWQAVVARKGRLTARSVESSLRAGTTTKGFAAGTDPSDIGAGLIAAP